MVVWRIQWLAMAACVAGGIGIDAGAATLHRPKPLVAPPCVDTAPPDPAAQFETLPVHAAIATYLEDMRAPATVNCHARRMNYRGERITDGVRVTSTYKGGKPHAEFSLGKGAETYVGRHGVMKSWWSNGQPQSLEYFCESRAVGFHRYFDEQGQLVRVVDYTRSDYDFSKAMRGARTFHDAKGSNYGTLNFGGTHFRRVLLVTPTEARQLALAVGDGNWSAIDPTLTVDDLVLPGATAWFQHEVWRLQIHNRDWGYESFASVYQRTRAGTLAAPLRWPTKEIMACPWLDEAMAPGMTDARFRFVPVDMPHETPEVRALRCIEKPDIDCLLRSAFDGHRVAKFGNGGDLKPLARVAIAVRRPGMALQAMEQSLNDAHNFDKPSPFFAEDITLRAEGERLQNQAAKADASFKEALLWASTARRDAGGQQDARLAGLAGMRLAIAGRTDEARALYDIAMTAPWGQSRPLRRRIGEEIAAAKGFEAAAEFFRAHPARPPETASRGNWTPSLDYLATLAETQLLRGDSPSREAYEELLATLRSGSHGQDSQNPVITVIGPLAARLCDQGQLDHGRALLAAVPVEKFGRGFGSFAPRSAQALGELRCVDEAAARRDFTKLLAEAAKLREPGGDEIFVPSLTETARYEVLMRIVEARAFDLMPDLQGFLRDEQLTHQLLLAQVKAQARAGDGAAALRTLDGIVPPNPLRYSNPPFAYETLLARGEVLGRLGEASAQESLAQARQLALTVVHDLEKVQRLAGIADVQRRLGQSGRARELLAETLPVLNRLRAAEHHSARQREWLAASALASAYASLGDDTTARRLMSGASAEDAALGQEELDWLQAAAARGAFQRKDFGGAKASLDAIASVSLRAEALAGAPDRPEFQALRQAAREQLPAAFDGAVDAAQRRRLIHAYLSSSVANTELLGQLRQQLELITEGAQRARATCELAAAYRKANDLPAAEDLWRKAATQSSDSRMFPWGAPRSGGACAWWARQAGDVDRARQLLESNYTSLRTILREGKQFDQQSLANWFMEIAMALYESEHGELFDQDWATPQG